MESIKLPMTLPEPLQMVHMAHFSSLDPERQSKCIIDRIIQASKLPTQASSSNLATAEEIEAADHERSLLDFAFIDPTKLCSKQHILTAVMQAAVVCARSWDEDQRAFKDGQGSSGGMKSKTPHSEIIYMLNPSNNVGESLKRFGISAKSTSLLLIKFSSTSADPETILRSMTDVVNQQHQDQTHLTCPSSDSADSVDLDQAIRYNCYPSDHQPALQTDWKELNKIYKLQMPSQLLAHSSHKLGLQAYEDIVCTSVAMKLVAA